MTADDLKELAARMAEFYDDPLGFVMYAFPWTTDKAIQLVPLPAQYRDKYQSEFGPDLWACDFLEELGAEVRKRRFDGQHAVDPIRMATASGHGIGKSSLTGWLVPWIMSTRPFCKGTVTANTYTQLHGKTWAQIAYWFNRSITASLFQINTGKGNMQIYQHDHPESWVVKGETSDEHNSESFAGQHAANSTSFYIFDEASAIHNKVFEVAEGGLTDGEPMFFTFGNPVRGSGEFHKSFHGMRHRWITRQIDSRTAHLPNKEKIAQDIADFGIDSDRVKVRVRGMFPSASTKQFIGTNLVDAAQKVMLRKEQVSFAPIIITCDPAWEGDDDLVIAMRQGLMFKILKVLPKNDDDIYIANLLMNFEDEYDADAVFIDMGYGTGIYSAGKSLGRNWRLVEFGGASSNPGYLNKRAEMWGLAKDWLKEGGSIPDDAELYADLTGPETVPRLDGKIQLESKQDMKRRKLPSPNKADALALSFAFPVLKKQGIPRGGRDKAFAVRGHDPFKR